MVFENKCNYKKCGRFKIKVLHILLLCSTIQAAMAQNCDNTCHVFNTDQELIGVGLYLKDTIIPAEFINTITVEYADTVYEHSNSGQLRLVERSMDIYFPSPEISLINTYGDTIKKLPVMFLLHAKNGQKESMVERAKMYLQRGMMAVALNYRADVEPVEYCLKLESMLYKSTQDIRGAMRMFHVGSVLSETLSNAEIEAVYGPEVAELAGQLANLPIDTSQYYISGYSYGSTAALNTVLRINQDDWRDFLYESGLTITGEFGPHTFSPYGFIDDIGLDSLTNFAFPIGSIKGAVCRTSVVTDLAAVDFLDHPQEIPIAFFHGTCDGLVPFDFEERTEYDPNVCLPQYTITSTGESIESLPLYGSFAVSQVLEAQNRYFEMTTFCGGGHNTNTCVDDLITTSTFEFIAGIYCDELNWQEPKKVSYIFDESNYSNQCCGENVVADMLNREPCLCDGENPPILLDPIAACAANACPNLEYCPVGIAEHNSSNRFTISSRSAGGTLELSIFSPEPVDRIQVRIFAANGACLSTEWVHLEKGDNLHRISITLSQGVYLCQLGTGATGKVVVL